MAIAINGNGTITGITAGGLPNGSIVEADIADNAITGGKLNISLVAGDTMYASATDTLAKLAKGTAAQVLTMNAGATAPEWAAAAGGGGGAWNLLQSTTISSSTASVAWGSSYITSTYKRFKVQVLDTIPVSDNVRFDMNFTTDNGSSYITTNYRGGTHWLYGNNSSFADASAGGGGDSYLRAGGNNNGNATGERGNYIIYLDNLTTNQYHYTWGFGVYGSSDDKTQHVHFANFYPSTGSTVAVNGIKLSYSSGNITSGIFKLYGLTS